MPNSMSDSPKGTMWSAPSNQQFTLAARSQSVPVPSVPWIKTPHQLSWSTGAENCQDVNSSTEDSNPRTVVKTVLALRLEHAAKPSDESNNCVVSALPRSFKWLPCSPPEAVISMGNERGLWLRQSDPETLKVFCRRFSDKVPWQSENANKVLDCRFGVRRRPGNLNLKSDVWVLVLDPDRVGKRNMAKALAEVVYGSHDKLIPVSISRKNSSNPRWRI